MTATMEIDQEQADRIEEAEREYVALLQSKHAGEITDEDLAYLEKQGWIFSQTRDKSWIANNPDLQLYTSRGLSFENVGEAARAAVQLAWAKDTGAIATMQPPPSIDEQIDSAITRLFSSPSRNLQMIADLKKNGASDRSLLVFLKSYIGKSLVESKGGSLVSITAGTKKVPGLALYLGNHVGVGEPAMKGSALFARIRTVLDIPTCEQAAERQAEAKAEEAAADVAVETTENIPENIPEIEPIERCRVCGCTDETPCFTESGSFCYRNSPAEACSNCKTIMARHGLTEEALHQKLIDEALINTALDDPTVVFGAIDREALIDGGICALFANWRLTGVAALIKSYPDWSIDSAEISSALRKAADRVTIQFGSSSTTTEKPTPLYDAILDSSPLRLWITEAPESLSSTLPAEPDLQGEELLSRIHLVLTSQKADAAVPAETKTALSDGKDAGVWYDEGPQAIVNVPTMEQWEKSFEKEPETAPVQPSLFDYSALDSETRIVVQQRAVEIKSLVKQTTTAICDIGGKLAEVKSRLKHGQWLPWLEREFDWSSQTAARFMQVHDRFAQIQHRDEFQKLDLSALYLLAAPSAPEGATVEALARAESGERITKPVAEEIVDRYKADEIPPQPDLSGIDQTVQVEGALIIGVCRICGCTHDEPCEVENTETGQAEGCAWVEGTNQTLCSNCNSIMISRGWSEETLRARLESVTTTLAADDEMPEDDDEAGTSLERLEARGWKFTQADDQRWTGTNEISNLKTSSYAKLERAVESAVSLQRGEGPAPRRVEPGELADIQPSPKSEPDLAWTERPTITTPRELAAYLENHNGLIREELLKLGVLNTVIEQAISEKLIYKSRMDETYKAERVQPEASKTKAEPAKPPTSSTPVVGPEPASMKRVSDTRENFAVKLKGRPLDITISFIPTMPGKIVAGARIGKDASKTKYRPMNSSELRLPMPLLDLISEVIDAADKETEPEPAKPAKRRTVKQAATRSKLPAPSAKKKAAPAGSTKKQLAHYKRSTAPKSKKKGGK